MISKEDDVGGRVKRVQDGSDVTCFGSFDNSTSERVLSLLEAGYLRLGRLW